MRGGAILTEILAIPTPGLNYHSDVTFATQFSIFGGPYKVCLIVTKKVLTTNCVLGNKIIENVIVVVKRRPVKWHLANCFTVFHIRTVIH